MRSPFHMRVARCWRPISQWGSSLPTLLGATIMELSLGSLAGINRSGGCLLRSLVFGASMVWYSISRSAGIESAHS